MSSELESIFKINFEEYISQYLRTITNPLSQEHLKSFFQCVVIAMKMNNFDRDEIQSFLEQQLDEYFPEEEENDDENV